MLLRIQFGRIMNPVGSVGQLLGGGGVYQEMNE